MCDSTFYLEEINNSPLFGWDRESNPTAYEREKNRLIEAIYLYKLAENPKNEELGLEIVETVGSCLKYYERGKGDFINYFNRSFAQKRAMIQAKESLQNISLGIHFSEKEISNSRAIYSFLQRHEDVSIGELTSFLSKYIEEFEMNEKELKDAITTYSATLTQSGDAALSDDDSGVLFDTIAEKGDFTEYFDSRAAVQTMMEQCDECFLESRESTKEFLSIKLTALFFEWYKNQEYTDLIKTKSFFNSKIYSQLLLGKTIPKNKELSVLLNKSEPNLTQIWKRFQKKLRELL